MYSVVWNQSMVSEEWMNLLSTLDTKGDSRHAYIIEINKKDQELPNAATKAGSNSE